MKKTSLLLIFLLTTLFGFTQSNNNIDIKGRAADTLNAALPFASVLLLDPSDTTLITYTQTKDDGSFEFKDVKSDKYLVKITFIGYIPLMVKANGSQGNNINLGTLKLKEIASELMEVVVREAKAPLTIRGDTIEYDATTFKVPPGSSVEDLLRKLPGIEVGSDGSIKSQGQDVTKVTVDGKRFFGSDPKAATKNLPAEGISKVQVFNEETEEKKLTGVSSTPPDKTMNLQLKDDFKKGGFGKVTGGYGTEERAELKANYNKFNEKEQFSLVGVANNTGRNGLSWDDYQDFKGSQSFNWDDGEEFGFGSGRGGHYIIFSDGESDEEESGLTSSFFGNSQSGIPTNYSGGINYNYDHKKTKFSTLYYYDQKALFSEAERFQQNFLPDRTYFNNEESTNDKKTGSHQAEIRWEEEIDSLNTLVISTNFNANDSKTTTLGNYIYTREDGSKSNQSDYSINNHNKSINGKGSIVYRKKFKKKGRSLGLSATYFGNTLDKDGVQQSDNRFFDEAGALDSTSLISQLFDSKSQRTQLSANGMYVEPLSKKFFWQSFYNFSKRTENADRNVFDKEINDEIQNDILSRFYDNSVQLNRFGTSFRYSANGVNVSIGAAIQSFDITGAYHGGPSSGISGGIHRVFTNYIPNVNVTLSLKRNQYLNGGYTVYATEPSANNLQPIIDNSNPLFIKVGNPDLIPEIGHNINIGYNKFNPATFVNFYAHLGYNYYENQFIQEQTIDSNQVVTSRPINFTGGQGLNSYLGFGFPIIKNKFTINLNYSFVKNSSFAFVNKIKNNTITNGHYPGLRINFTPGEIYSIYANASYNISDTKYDINNSQDQFIVNQYYSLEFNSKVIWGIYFNSKLVYNIYQNDNLGVNRNVPLLNMSIYKIFLKNNRGELRFSIYDVFDKNISISQYASSYRVSETRTESLRRYAMLSFTYNLRGVTSEIKKKNGWW